MAILSGELLGGINGELAGNERRYVSDHIAAALTFMRITDRQKYLHIAAVI
ncbi:hypothetical protein KCP70_05620 [Salmonella enterica subsp. enterica]|nr:hypothetical protein KCP70_05620 [Salmonella enterica subsp. enterica]